MRSRADLRPDEFDEGAALAELARAWLEAAPPAPDDEVPSDEPYRVVLVHCPDCGRTAGVDHDVSDEVAGEAGCDAEVIDLRPGPDDGRRVRTLPPRLRRRVLHHWGWKCAVPGCEHRHHLHVHHLEPWARGGDHAVDNLVVACGQHHRLLHAGRLAMERRPDGAIEVRRATGPVLVARPPRPTP